MNRGPLADPTSFSRKAARGELLEAKASGSPFCLGAHSNWEREPTGEVWVQQMSAKENQLGPGLTWQSIRTLSSSCRWGPKCSDTGPSPDRWEVEEGFHTGSGLACRKTGRSLVEARREGFCAGRDPLIDSLVQKPGNVSQSAQRLCGAGGKEGEIGGEGWKSAKRSVVPSRASAGRKLRAAL